ncbi:hypothetical protein QFC21_004535 [Naganishia friedmannii]|uniref:Uncharacterized protein n=1 Tax=Naganishia friedmannii TaxID=89922 RepID=A0ACC2VHB8_9TREE|nr:hypothetical protein QFC21_004535 [Naganishia friedmannii]
MVKSVANPTYTPVAHPAQPFRTFNEFYPFYLGEHSLRINRIFHLTGTSIALACHTRVLLSLIPYIARQLSLRVGPQTFDVLRKLQLSRNDALKIALGGLVQGYFFAWIGHFVVENNKPATFKYPVFSLRGDFRMLWEVISMQRSV